MVDGFSYRHFWQGKREDPDVEGASFSILASGRRPSVETVRQTLGRGSPATIAACLKRFWQTLGTRAEGNPAALARFLEIIHPHTK